jgi:hypothetical protein
MPARPDSATIVQQTLRDVFPDGMRSEQPNRVEPLDFDVAGAPGASNTEHFARDLRQAPLLNGQPGAPGRARIAEKGFPIFVRQIRNRSRIGVRSWLQRLGRKFFHLLRGRHSPGRWSVAHFSIRTYREQKSSRAKIQHLAVETRRTL